MEIEIKVQIEKSRTLQAFLRKNAKQLFSNRQKDLYYMPVHRNFVAVSPIEEWFRLRDSNGKYSINYKKWFYEKDGTSNHCDEYETGVVSFGETKKILAALNYKHIITVDKKRTTWVYRDYEISFDDVRGLGTFVEVEYTGKAKKSDAKQIAEDMLSFLKKHNVGFIKRNFKGYPYLLLEKKKYI
jgi:adenylate cyclase class 2